MILVERLQVYTPEDASGIGRLRPYLVEGANDKPVEESHLRSIIESSEHDQLVARIEDTRQIIGAATLTIITGALTGKKGWLEDFVADPTVDIKGIGQSVWDEMGAWCLEHNIELEFTSRESRTAAHKFYHKNGAKVRDTVVFKKKFND